MSTGILARRRPLALPALPPRMRRWLAVTLAAMLVLAAGYMFWLRDSSLVAVDEVTVTGLTTEDAARVRAALESAAHNMTTLHVQHEELLEAVAAYPVVRELQVRADFPHAMSIRVIEHRPAALVGGLPVAGDGTILRGLPVEGSLPELDVRAKVTGDRLRAPAALDAAHVAGTAPSALGGRLERIELRSEEGIVVQLRDGPEIYFGDAGRARAKWTAAARVLADPAAAGATYVDVRLPDRPAAGGLPAETVVPVAPAGSTLDGIDPSLATVSPAAAAPVDPAGAEPATGMDPAASAPAGTTGTAPATEPVSPSAPPPSSAPTTGAPAPAAAESTGGGAGPAPSG